ncbi:sporulation protein [Heyndrickxia oleronia]|uniref:sporulation membrane protein YtrI n=1 Tax=Heyndrickxia oleronia TaxID=38875 RepID=UPI00203D1F51|nr:sporulation membrane protein YtrI [Heyndrickxia oleronia]MCM3237249.1 sporulation protein [Heyndrickxia oleronia]
MRIPPLYRRPAWQRFIAGVVIGGCISWIIFLFMFGVLQEKQAKKIKSQTEIINNLKQDKKIWQEDYKELNRKNAELLIIQKVQVKIKNYEKYKIDHLSIMEAENRIKDDLSSLIAKDLYNTYKNKDLVYKTIENRIDKFNNRPYKYTIKNIVFYSTISIELEIKLS